MNTEILKLILTAGLFHYSAGDKETENGGMVIGGHFGDDVFYLTITKELLTAEGWQPVSLNFTYIWTNLYF